MILELATKAAKMNNILMKRERKIVFFFKFYDKPSSRVYNPLYTGVYLPRSICKIC